MGRVRLMTVVAISLFVSVVFLGCDGATTPKTTTTPAAPTVVNTGQAPAGANVPAVGNAGAATGAAPGVGNLTEEQKKAMQQYMPGGAGAGAVPPGGGAPKK